MKVVHYWYGAFGRYEIPSAIIWLADEANKRIGEPSITELNGWHSITERDESPGYRVMSELGEWRDGEEAKRLREEMPA